MNKIFAHTGFRSVALLVVLGILLMGTMTACVEEAPTKTTAPSTTQTQPEEDGGNNSGNIGTGEVPGGVSIEIENNEDNKLDGESDVNDQTGTSNTGNTGNTGNNGNNGNDGNTGNTGNNGNDGNDSNNGNNGNTGNTDGDDTQQDNEVTNPDGDEDDGTTGDTEDDTTGDTEDDTTGETANPDQGDQGGDDTTSDTEDSGIHSQIDGNYLDPSK